MPANKFPAAAPLLSDEEAQQFAKRALARLSPVIIPDGKRKGATGEETEE